MKRIFAAFLLALLPFAFMFCLGVYCNKHSVKNTIKYTPKDGVVLITDYSNLKKY